jgi:glyoxylase-like metal-dependent hydrolase (beta-lactamase superfamily II)
MNLCVPAALQVSVPGAPLSLSVYQADSKSFHVASTLVMGATDAVLIDAQFTFADAHRVVANILASGKRLTTVYISHGDPDFYFGLEIVRQAFPDVRIVATAQTVDHIHATGTGKIELWGPMVGRNGPKNIVLP